MAFDLVLFGGTGDLAWRKLMPALFQAFRHGTLPEGGRIIGVGRETLSSEQYRSRIQARFDEVELAKRPSAEEFTRFAALLEFYNQVKLKKAGILFLRLSARILLWQVITICESSLERYSSFNLCISNSVLPVPLRPCIRVDFPEPSCSDS